jgi:hypothetical protein
MLVDTNGIVHFFERTIGNGKNKDDGTVMLVTIEK